MIAATRLFQKGCDEQLVCEITGNTSEAVHAYKRTSNKMQESLSNVLYGNLDESEMKQSLACSKVKEVCKSVVSTPPIVNTDKEEIVHNQNANKVFTNVMYNVSEGHERPVINVYPVINIACNLPAQLIIVNIHFDYSSKVICMLFHLLAKMWLNSFINFVIVFTCWSIE